MNLLDTPRLAAPAPEESRIALRVAIDCLRVNPSFVGGVTSYVLGLLEGLSIEGHGCEFQVFVTSANLHLFEQFRRFKNIQLIVVDERRVSVRASLCRAVLLSNSRHMYEVASNLAFRSLQQRMEAESDLIYTPTPVLSSFNSRTPTVLSMHDIQHMHHPEFFSWSVMLSRRITYTLSARHSSYIQASTNYIKDDLLAHFPWLSANQIEVIPSGVFIEKFARGRKQHGLKGYQLPERFLLFPAQMWPHKDHLTLLRALKQIESDHGVKIPLVLTGEAYAAAPQILRFVAENSMNYVQYLGKVTFEVLVALYQKAAFMVTATLHESSSLPVLEAAAAGTPIIATRIPPIQELGKVLQLNLFEPRKVGELAELIFSLWNDQRTSELQATFNREHITEFSWQRTARKYIEFFDRIANR